MATPSKLVPMETRVVSAPCEGRTHLQRLIRKVKHVLIVKRCIDDLKGGVGLRQCRRILIQKRNDSLPGLSNGPASLTDLQKLGPVANTLNYNGKALKVPSRKNEAWPKSIGAQLQEILPQTEDLQSLETHLDWYISRTYENLRKCKQSLVNTSRDFWIRWSRKRGASVHDTRSQAILIKLLGKEEDGTDHLTNLQRYLEAYIAGSFGRALETLSEVVSRLREVFGIGWFFEWPSGRHPLNSTWPWADVKPSLLVLWGVCWMFFPTYYGEPYGQDYSESESRQQLYNNTGYFQSQLPTQQAPPSQPVVFTNPMYDPALLPERQLATHYGYASSRQTQPMMQGTIMPWAYGGVGQDSGHFNAALAAPSHSVPATGAASTRGPLTLNYWYLHRDVPPNQVFDGVRNSPPPNRNVAELWLGSTNQLREPYLLGESSALFKAATPSSINTRPIHHLLPPYTPALSTSAPMPSTTAFSSYPPLDNMSEMHDPRAPYMVEQERAYNQMSDPHPYDHHHDPQQDPPRYPTPPPPLSENPYNAQGATGETPDSRMEMPMEQKSESDAPSPGRSKPVPKPDREVTKDANGRFYCSWPGCTEDVKDFGRKCEWSKHMDKHDRPYKCPADGCEKLPGFTYSGGLLRHEREVHNKHGGPRKQLNCPHPNCKRHTGKGFSRQENLNEHLRRVHTDTGLPLNGEETEDDANEAQSGGKRKRTRGDSADLREEMKRLKQENEELRRQAEAQTAQSAEMMRQIMQLQQAQQLQASMQHPRMQAPPAQMT